MTGVTISTCTSDETMPPSTGAASGRITDIRNRLGTGDSGTHQFTGIYAVSPEFLPHLSPGKIESVINNARRYLELVATEGSLAEFVWRFEPDPASRPRRITWEALRAMPTTPESTALSKELKDRGWTFVGPTTAYAFMQAMGMVNDHVEGCRVRGVVASDRQTADF